MPDSVHLSVANLSSHASCSLCASRPGLLQYELESQDGRLHGYCCAACATNLIAALEEIAGARRDGLTRAILAATPLAGSPVH